MYVHVTWQQNTGSRPSLRRGLDTEDKTLALNLSPSNASAAKIGLHFQYKEKAQKLKPSKIDQIATAENMSETQKSNGGFLQGVKEFFAESFYLNEYSKILHPEKPLPHWDSSVVEEFIASDPVHGPTLKTAREAAKFGAVGAAIGAVATGGNAWRWSKSPHGAALAFAFGGVVGFTLGAEVANHWYQLYRLDTLEAQAKFFEWLQKRA